MHRRRRPQAVRVRISSAGTILTNASTLTVATPVPTGLGCDVGRQAAGRSARCAGSPDRLGLVGSARLARRRERRRDLTPRCHEQPAARPARRCRALRTGLSWDARAWVAGPQDRLRGSRPLRAGEGETYAADEQASRSGRPTDRRNRAARATPSRSRSNGRPSAIAATVSRRRSSPARAREKLLFEVVGVHSDHVPLAVQETHAGAVCSMAPAIGRPRGPRTHRRPRPAPRWRVAGAGRRSPRRPCRPT